jgi:hypothetical protein
MSQEPGTAPVIAFRSAAEVHVVPVHRGERRAA